MKRLIVLSIFFSFGVGEEDQGINQLLDLKKEGERELSSARSLNNHFQSLLQPFITGPSELPLCTDVKVIIDEYSTQLKKVILPMNDWISQMSRQMKTLNVYLNQLQINGDLIDSDLTSILPHSLVGDCNFSFSKEKPDKKSLNTNDIYSFQKNLNCERGGSEEFQCRSGECVDFNRTCDGVFDCWDGSDEFGACEEKVGCEECSEYCVLGASGPQCVAKCPVGFQYSMKFCPNLKPCYSLCLRKSQRKTIPAKCLVQMIPNLSDTTVENYFEIKFSMFHRIRQQIMKCEATFTPTPYPTTRHPTWHPTTRHPTWHPTTRHPTWHPTTRHPTWHPTTRHPTWHPTTRHPTWHPTTSHPTWHPTTRHPTWHPTTRHPTWHPTTRHTTWHPTTRHPTWHPTTRHPTWHPTTRHPTWHPTTSHPTTRHPTWHPTTKHTTWHTTTEPTTWNPSVSVWNSIMSYYSTLIDEQKHHTTKHTTPHSTTAHTRHTTRHHTTKHTTHHTTQPTTPTTQTTPHTITPTKSTTAATTTSNADGNYIVFMQ